MKSLNIIQAFVSGCSMFVYMACLSLYPSQAQAGFYKCIDSEGNTTYSQTECPVDEKTDKIISAGGGSSSNNDCRIARHFMSKTAKQMLRGQSSGEVYDQYGGIDSIPRTSVALVNYVYTFQHNHSVTEQRITSLSVARCQSGSFGPTSCEDFPYSYIDELGGCEQAVMGPNYGRRAAEESRDELGSESPQTGVQRSTAGFNFGNQTGVNSAQAVKRAKKDCIAFNKAELDSISNSMRGRMSAGQQDSLRAEKRRLQKKLSGC